MRDAAALCALNNAQWCDSVCRAHGVPGTFGAAIWTQMRRGPPYYSNAVTLSRSEQDIQRAAIDELCFALPDGFSVKDSFGCLDLSEAGFRSLFDAEWVWLVPAVAVGPKAAGEWIRVRDAADLERWEAAWGAAGSPANSRVFPPSLLLDAGIAFLGAKLGGEFVAGCVANRSSGDVIGFSNFFAATDPGDDYRAGAVAQVQGFAPGSPVVGYDRGDELAGLHALGFRTVGRLRVWVSD